MKTVTSRTRAPRQGKLVYCPKCGAQAKFSSFNWSETACRECHADIKKLQWLLEDPKIEHDRAFMVLVNDRNWDDSIYKFNEHLAVTYGFFLDWVDSSGSRSVHVYRPFKSDDPEAQMDLPHWVFEEFQVWFQQRHGKTPEEAGMKLLRRMEDPGMGIVFPEDIEMLKKIIAMKENLEPEGD